MATQTRRMTANLGLQLQQALANLPRHIRIRRGWVFGAIILVGLIAFETFNFSTTHFALSDLLGGLSFAGVEWAVILALAFCSIDFAGIARLMTPEDEDGQPTEVWYLLGAWFLGATMNASLTWWSVSLALIGHQGLGNEILGREALLNAVPIFIAGLVWLIRVLLIGTLTLAGGRIFSSQPARQSHVADTIRSRPATVVSSAAASSARRSAARPSATANRPTVVRMRAGRRS